MNETKFTKGPWESDEVSDDGAILAIGGINIAMVSSPDDFPCLDLDGLTPEGLKSLWNEHRANRSLIAAAPELYEALRALCAWHDHPALTGNKDGAPVADWAPSFDKTVTMVHAALAKARGEQA